MIEKIQLVPLPHKQSLQWQKKYLASLSRPMDGMWFQISQSAQFWKIRVDRREIGYFCVDSSNILLQFYIVPEYLIRADFIFGFLADKRRFTAALVSTGDSLVLSASLELTQKIEVNAYLFSELNRNEIPLINQASYQVKKASEKDFNKAAFFYTSSIGTPLEWTRQYTEKIIYKKGLYFFENNEETIGIGEFRCSEHQRPYVDLGVIIAKEHRGKKHGASIIAWLRGLAHKEGKVPICSCEKNNLASLNTLVGAGFIPSHKLFKVSF